MFNLDLRPQANLLNATGLFENDLQNWFGQLKTEAFVPACDVVENEKEYLFSFEIPGFNKEDITIELKDRELIVSGKYQNETKKENERYLKKEMTKASFRRGFALPDKVDEQGIIAKFENGILEIQIPKSEKVLARKIEILS